MDMRIRNGRVLLPDGDVRQTDILVADGAIREIGGSRNGSLSGEKTLDVGGRLVLPGIVDLHGDGFERHIMPRAGVSFSRALGLLDTDRTMTANGITTAFHGLTCSWEPGLRSREAARAFLADFQAVRARLGCDTRLHLRFETYNLPALDEVEAWILDGTVDMLAFNDHIDAMFDNLDRYSKMSGYLDRTGLNREAFINLITEIKERAAAVPEGIRRLAGAAAGRNIPMASHDDPDPDTRSWYDGLGCAISEFPLDEDTARSARDLGGAVILGAPNALRGKSHIDRLMARDAIRMNLCDALTSDYFYPSLLQAAFALAGDKVCPFPDAWRLVSEGPARAAKLSDRGVIEPGRRADLVIVDDSDPALPFAAMTLRQGTPVFSANGLGM
ncbi:MAG: alpha-D-ribose 1-methylphosphonate 5-triphosphate diphosphatase [Pseudodesulfovibrio sp.]|uniref:alpha-D-ribose 1-methylphosphonate 5-triphosphate diphosphatase n=1 Tax=Pseudodesulfovibrio sp. TaxID=2035812 RepID=UPI003D13F94B